MLCLIIISFHSLICVQLTKTTLIFKRNEYIVLTGFSTILLYFCKKI